MTVAVTDPTQRATAWLDALYGGLVELAVPHPVHETSTSWLMACRTLNQPGFPRTPMLAASVVVPKIGGFPFHPASSAPFADLEPVSPEEAARRVTGQNRRINARGCVTSVHTMVEGNPSVALPWQPAHEAPGWWSRLNRRYFPRFEHVPVNDWSDIVRAVRGPGPGTRGVVWVRREAGGQEVTGNLIHVHNNRGQAVFLDGITAALARLDTESVRELVLVRDLP
ncbi:toxin glutamine deamidase domain-containing protein [Streptomyces sp. NPDC058469]|uniref:toxin glutamine deamidase domain-containing protein n=1 Tax=Streptomyces sp. NPDC058469 TaxID=3346514 RepID=UPI00365E7C31